MLKRFLKSSTEYSNCKCITCNGWLSHFFIFCCCKNTEMNSNEIIFTTVNVWVWCGMNPLHYYLRSKWCVCPHIQHTPFYWISMIRNETIHSTKKQTLTTSFVFSFFFLLHVNGSMGIESVLVCGKIHLTVKRTMTPLYVEVYFRTKWQRKIRVGFGKNYSSKVSTIEMMDFFVGKKGDWTAFEFIVYVDVFNCGIKRNRHDRITSKIAFHLKRLNTSFKIILLRSITDERLTFSCNYFISHIISTITRKYLTKWQWMQQ